MEFLKRLTTNTSSEDVASGNSGPEVYDYFKDSSGQRKPCYYETILSEHIQTQIVEKRTRCDNALVRASSILTQTNKLKENTSSLEDECGDLESLYQRVANLVGRVTQDVEKKLPFQSHQRYLGRLIATLMGEHEWGEEDGHKRIARFYSPCDWMRVHAGPKEEGRKMPRARRPILKSILRARK